MKTKYNDFLFKEVGLVIKEIRKKSIKNNYKIYKDFSDYLINQRFRRFIFFVKCAYQHEYNKKNIGKTCDFYFNYHKKLEIKHHFFKWLRPICQNSPAISIKDEKIIFNEKNLLTQLPINFNSKIPFKIDEFPSSKGLMVNEALIVKNNENEEFDDDEKSILSNVAESHIEYEVIECIGKREIGKNVQYCLVYRDECINDLKTLREKNS